MPICPSSCKNFCLVCAGQILCMLSQSPWVPMCNCPVLFRKVSLEVIQHLWFLQSYLPFSEDSEPWLERCDMSVLFRAKHLGFLFSHEHFKFRFVFFFHSLFDFLNPFWLGVGHNFLLGVCFLVIFLLWGCIPSLPPFLYPLFVPPPPHLPSFSSIGSSHPMFLLFVFWNRVYDPGWLQTRYPPVLVSWALGLQPAITMITLIKFIRTFFLLTFMWN